jgi:hypothetical protein
MSHNLNAEQDHNIKVANTTFQNVARFKYLRTVANQNVIHEKIKSK